MTWSPFFRELTTALDARISEYTTSASAFTLALGAAGALCAWHVQFHKATHQSATMLAIRAGKLMG